MLLDRHADRVYAVCRRVLVNREDARDAAQEALLAITRGIGRYDGRAQFTTWMYRVATNAALDEARRLRRRPEPVDAVDAVPAAVAGAADLATSVTDRLVLDAALLELAPDYRAAVALRDLVGLDYAEIARVLDIPIGTVRSRIARGRSKLADTLGNQTEGSDRPTGTS